MARFDIARDRIAESFCAIYADKAEEQFGLQGAGKLTDEFSELIRIAFVAGWDARDYMRQPEDEGEIIASLRS